MLTKKFEELNNALFVYTTNNYLSIFPQEKHFSITPKAYVALSSFPFTF